MDDVIRLQRDTVEEHIRHENAKNWDGVYDTFVHDETAFYDVVPFNTRFPGFGGVQGFYASANAAFPDFKIHVWGEYDAPGCSVREVTISGTHTGDWGGVPGTGRYVRFQLAGFFLFGSGEQAGKLLAERIYFDNEMVMRQIRGEMDAASVADFPLPELTEASSGDGDEVEDIIRIQRETVDEHIRQENSKNWQEVFDTFVPDETAFCDVVPFNTRFAGLDGVKSFLGGADAAFPDFRVDVWAQYDLPGRSIREVTISGTHTGEWCGVPGTGRPLRFQLAGFYLFGSGQHAGKILAGRIYFDNDTVMRQIRGEMDSASVADFPLPEMTEARSGD